MRKKAGIVFVMMGVVLMIAALLLFLHNEGVEAHAEEASRTVMEELRRKIPQKPETAVSAEEKVQPEREEILPVQEEESLEMPETEETPDKQTIYVDGYEYIGFLTIPDLSLELPVIADWDEKKLETAPCRHFGSAETGDLVIAGHNYRKHFGRLDRLKIGGSIRFTDIEGKVYDYVIREMKTLEATDVDVVLESERELILYTCTYTGKTRLVLGCEAVTETNGD